MNLAIDIGNTVAKLAIIDNGQVVDFLKTEDIDAAYVEDILVSYKDIESAILVSVREDYCDIESLLENRLPHFVRFTSNIAVPLKNCYATPTTLGLDRMAAAVGANALYPESNILVADFGTTITIDLVSSKGEFMGGNISPGAAMRFKALHQQTKKLPLVSMDDSSLLIGTDTPSAIKSGVINGIVYEIEGYIRDMEQKYDDLRIIFTGGDGNFFAKRLKKPIFATYDLVAYGLNRILEYNAK